MNARGHFSPLKLKVSFFAVLKGVHGILLLLVLASGALTMNASAQSVPPSARSYSGQFVLVGSSALGSLQGFKPELDPNRSYVELNPMLLPVSCERIRRWVLNELAAPGTWQGKILLYLRPAIMNDPGVLVAADRYQNGWQYTVELPTRVDRTIYLRGIVRALLLEMGNRNAEAPGVELPDWLIEGLTREIMASREVEVILAPPQSSVNGLPLSESSLSRVRQDPVDRSYNVLRTSGFLTFDQLSWPAKSPDAGVGSDIYCQRARICLEIAAVAWRASRDAQDDRTVGIPCQLAVCFF